MKPLKFNKTCLKTPNVYFGKERAREGEGHFPPSRDQIKIMSTSSKPPPPNLFFMTSIFLVTAFLCKTNYEPPKIIVLIIKIIVGH